MTGADALRQQLLLKGFTLADGKWKHPDLRDYELLDESITAQDGNKVQTLIRLIQSHPTCAKYAPMASGQTSKSGPAGRLVG